MRRTRDLARGALPAALSRHTTEPTLVTPDGRRFSESELRHLEQRGALATLEDMADTAAHFLRAIDRATTQSGPGRGIFPPPGTVFLLPAEQFPFIEDLN